VGDTKILHVLLFVFACWGAGREERGEGNVIKKDNKSVIKSKRRKKGGKGGERTFNDFEGHISYACRL
jgi:hypothetical protein